MKELQISEKRNESEKRLEFYRLIGEGYKAIHEKREITLEEMIQKIKKTRV